MKQLKFKPNVSAVIPAYNAEKFIPQTVESLKNQSFSLAEIIIVVDQSTDNTYTVAKRLADSFHGLIRVTRSNGPGASRARNLGVKLSRSEWILFMDADDLAEPNLLELEYLRLKELTRLWQKPAVLAYSAYQQIREDGVEIPGIHRSRQVEPIETFGYELVRNQIISTSGVLVEKKAFKDTGGFDPGIRYSEDWDLWLRLAMNSGFGYVDHPLVKVRRYAHNVSKSVSDMLEGERRVLGRYNTDFIQAAIEERLLPWEVNRIDLVAILYRLGKWEDGFRITQEVIKNYPEFGTGFFMAGLYQLYKQDWANAQKAFEVVIKYSPRHGAALNNLGVLLALHGRREQAKELFLKALSLFPGYIDATSNLNILENTGQLNPDQIQFTWRELRPILLSYQK